MKLVISPGLMVPSGSIESQRSQIVVAPIVTVYSHDGQLRSQQKRVRVVDVAGHRQRVGDERGAGEAGRDAVAVGGDEFRQPLPCPMRGLGVEQAEHDGERVDGDRVAA